MRVGSPGNFFSSKGRKENGLKVYAIFAFFVAEITKKRVMFMKFPIAIVSAIVSLVDVCAGEVAIPQGADVAPNGDRIEVTSKCLRLNGKAIIPLMGEMHYSRVPKLQLWTRCRW